MSDTNIMLSCKDFGHFDVVVVGGGCTGVFAAVRAARKGLKVAIVEKSNCFGGVATSGLVNIWHSLYDIYNKEQIIGGLTDEIVHTLVNSGYGKIEGTESRYISFDPNALKMFLDRLVTENHIKFTGFKGWCNLILDDLTLCTCADSFSVLLDSLAFSYLNSY